MSVEAPPVLPCCFAFLLFISLSSLYSQPKYQPHMLLSPPYLLPLLFFVFPAEISAARAALPSLSSLIPSPQSSSSFFTWWFHGRSLQLFLVAWPARPLPASYALRDPAYRFLHGHTTDLFDDLRTTGGGRRRRGPARDGDGRRPEAAPCRVGRRRAEAGGGAVPCGAETGGGRRRRRAVRGGAVLVFILVATAGGGGGGKAATPSQADALLAWKASLAYPAALSDWTRARPVCTWCGVGCDAAGRVAELRLRNLGLSGGADALDPAAFPGLAELDLGPFGLLRAGKDNGYEEPRRGDDAVAEHAERVGGDEEREHGARVVDVVGAGGVEVANGVVVDVEEEAGEVVVVARRAVEPSESVQGVTTAVGRKGGSAANHGRPDTQHNVRMDTVAASSSLCAWLLLQT